MPLNSTKNRIIPAAFTPERLSMYVCPILLGCTRCFSTVYALYREMSVLYTVMFLAVMWLLFALFESFLAGTSNHSFIWVYKWWGVIPVFITTYIPFFLASNYVPDMAAAKRKRFLITIWGLDALLLIVLIPLGII